MINKKNILDKFSNIDDKLLVTRVLDRANQAEKSWSSTCSDFLDPYQRKLVEKVLCSVQDIGYRFDGGYEGAERTIAVFQPEHMPDNEEKDLLRVVNIELKKEESLTHRDYLGSIMGLGIKREKIGDIIVREKSCSVIVLKDVADYILYNLEKVGRYSVDVSAGEPGSLKVPEPKTKEIKCTVPSLRLDCIVSNGFGVSRSQVAPLFKSGRVYVNWEPEESLSAQVSEGDTISVRGKGRVILDQIGKTTKKDRISIILKRLL